MAKIGRETGCKKDRKQLCTSKGKVEVRKERGEFTILFFCVCFVREIERE